MPLTDVRARTAKSREKAYKLADEKGLSLLVHPNGSKYWRLKYRHAGKEKQLALGVYPEVTLAQARELTLEARVLLKAGNDPGTERKATKARAVESRPELADRNMKAVEEMVAKHEAELAAG